MTTISILYSEKLRGLKTEDHMQRTYSSIPLRKMRYHICIMYELVNLLEPRVGIPVRKVLTHCPHDVTCTKLLTL